jgi:hypothetical protein
MRICKFNPIICQPINIRGFDFRFRIKTGSITYPHIICQYINNIRGLTGLAMGREKTANYKKDRKKEKVI